MPEQIVKSCPRCGKPMEIKINRKTNDEFIGCTGWQRGPEGCPYTEPLPEAIRLRRLGHKELFD